MVFSLSHITFDLHHLLSRANFQSHGLALNLWCINLLNNTNL